MLSKEHYFIEAAKYKKALLKIAYLKMGNHFDAEDMVEEALLHAYGKLDSLRNEEMLYPWLKRIVINQCNDLFRKTEKSDNSEKLLALDKHEHEDPEEKFTKNSIREEILDIMLSIEPEEYAEVLILFFYRNFSYDEISDETSVSVGTVKSRLSRAKEILLKKFKEKGITSKDTELIGSISQWPTPST
ncbi:MAG: RNA polymerase sigma factor [Spirochaetes bacterium]|nr:RNA polymerase sigma factor [Spirochaetota bacterium]MBN2769573.1 RNA polymerase sigma factor [Spirochaetota bacterium]